MNSIFVLTLGWILLLLIIVGLFLPVLPGIPTSIAALAILSRKYYWARRLLERARRAFPMLATRLQQLWRSVEARAGRRCPQPPAMAGASAVCQPKVDNRFA